jgi:hypothetical protein
MFNDSLSKRGQAAMITLGGTIITALLTQFVIDLYHTARNTDIHLAFQFQQPSFLLSILIIVGIVSGGFLVYDILDMRRKRNNRKAQFIGKVKRLENGDPDTESSK